MVGLTDAADRRVGGYSLGMRQRLGLAGALLGDPEVLVLDEPANGLDPDGVRWIREFLRYLADEGRTVFVSSHMLAEVSRMADEVVVINQGRFVTHAPVGELTVDHHVRVRTPDAARFELALMAHGAMVTDGDGVLSVAGLPIEEVGRPGRRRGRGAARAAHAGDRPRVRLLRPDGPEHGGAVMTGLLRSELRKVTGTRLALGLLLGALGIVAAGVSVTLWGPATPGMEVQGGPTTIASAGDVVEPARRGQHRHALRADLRA